MSEFNLKKLIQTALKLRLEPGLAYVSIGNFFATVLGAVLWIILGTLLVQEEYGQLNYFLAISTIATSVSIIGLNLTVTTFLAKKNEEILPQANTAVLFTSIASTIVVVILTSNPLLSLLVIGAAFFQMSTSELLGRQKYKEYMIVTMGQKALLVGSTFALYFVFGANGILVSFAISWFVFGYRYFISLRKASFNFASLKSKMHFAINNFISNISIAITFSYDKLLIGPIFGLGVLGIYQFGLQFLMFLSVVPGILFSYLLPEVASNKSRKFTVYVGLSFSVIIAIISVLASPWFIGGFFPNFKESILLTQILVIGVIPLTITSIMNSKLLGHGKSRMVLASALVYLGLQTLLVVVLGKSIGAVGLSIATLSALWAQALFLVLFSRTRISV